MKEELRDIIIKHEGISLVLYECTMGALTIGVGRNLGENGITRDEAMLMLQNDIDRCVRELVKFSWFVRLDEVRKGVLIELNFNLGLSRLLKFKRMIEALKIMDYESAVHEMLDSKWSRQVGDNRSKNMAHRLLNGNYPP